MPVRLCKETVSASEVIKDQCPIEGRKKKSISSYHTQIWALWLDFLNFIPAHIFKKLFMVLSQMFSLTLSSCLSTVHYCKLLPGMQVTQDIVIRKYLQGLSRWSALLHQNELHFLSSRGFGYYIPCFIAIGKDQQVSNCSCTCTVPELNGMCLIQ